MSKRKNHERGFYHFLTTFPDRLYPFKANVEGQWVRGMRAYDRAVERAFKKYGAGHYGFGLSCYRSLFHVVGSMLLIVAATFVARDYLGSERALYVLLSLVVVFIAFQEFYLHPRRYSQIFRKDMLDWLSWAVPIGVYLYFFI